MRDGVLVHATAFFSQRGGKEFFSILIEIKKAMGTMESGVETL